MPKKAYKKKKEFKAFCRDQVRKGLLNQPNGSWDKGADKDAMFKDCWNGYHFNRRG